MDVLIVLLFRSYTLTSVCVRALPGGHFW